MTKKISSLFLSFFVLTLVFTTVFASAATKKVAPMGTPNPEYPGTNIEMQVGDVLYASKSLDGSAAIVDHVGIVGDDFRVYHVSPIYENGYKGGKSDSINEYMTDINQVRR
ncbi:hypothetical protein [Paenibacillus tyrfis]|uniref:hypothetical protein n=1 Tax=Paenibacillus tyrfis TaxID=1501230 RepID=UPI0015C668AB|nr:hypothetical protein [Paenibacillus tyrfis]